MGGSGKMLVVRTGGQTRFGAIAAALAANAPPTALQQGVRKLGLLILRLTLFLTLFVLMSHLVAQRPAIESFLFAVALAVGLTPELLPMVMTVTLARGALPHGGPKSHRQATFRDPRSGCDGHALRRQDRHADGSQNHAQGACRPAGAT
ncbi:hypothetical protein [Bradyrhizobium centrolobii]|uniref:P-type ATPase n=1 Tax=Bradyrhizobium centrolobii TaxID=1505087 RepID=UPI0024C035AC|nr:hypothetical protein [Bradyrhizobium centrolobii]